MTAPKTLKRVIAQKEKTMSNNEWITIKHPSPESVDPYSESDFPQLGEPVELVTNNDVHWYAMLLRSEVEDHFICFGGKKWYNLLLMYFSSEKRYKLLNVKEVYKWRHLR